MSVGGLFVVTTESGSIYVIDTQSNLFTRVKGKNANTLDDGEDVQELQRLIALEVGHSMIFEWKHPITNNIVTRTTTVVTNIESV